jgi:uncharacterized protein YcbK (DUF882 family)
MLRRRTTSAALGTLLFAIIAATASPVVAQTRSAHEGTRRHHRHTSHAHTDARAYRANVHRWHDASDVAPAPRTPDGRLVLRLFSLNTHARAEIAPGAGDGPERFDAAACSQVATVLMDARTRAEHTIDPQLIDMLYRVAAHFDAREVRIVSGFRAESGHSNHALGRAVDFIIPGASDSAVVAYAQSLGDVGVGFYPVSGFVHLDVRDRLTTWVDASGPGAAPRYAHRHHHGLHHDSGRTAHR